MLLVTWHVGFFECWLLASPYGNTADTDVPNPLSRKGLFPQLLRVLSTNSLQGSLKGFAWVVESIFVQGCVFFPGSSYPVAGSCGSIKAWSSQPDSRQLWRTILALELPTGLALQLNISHFCFLPHSQMLIARRSLIKLHAQLHIRVSFLGEVSL